MVQLEINNGKKKMPVWAMIVLDVLLICCVLIVFAYFHHVLPQDVESVGLVIEKPPKTKPPAVTTTPPVVTTQPDPDDTPQITEPAELTWAEKFAEHFSDTVVTTDSSYKSPNISIEITKYNKGTGSNRMVYYVADLYITDIEQLQTCFAKDEFGVGRRETVLDMDKRTGAIMAVSGDYYGNSSSSIHSIVIRNGEVYRDKKPKTGVCVLYYDGTLETYPKGEFNLDEVIAKAPFQAWSFGPALLNMDGEALDSYKSAARTQEKNPRCGIGYYEPGHYCFVLVDGRVKDSKGATIKEFARIFEELGCAAAYNLDGGASAALTFNDKVFTNPPGGGRPISDCIIIMEAEQ